MKELSVYRSYGDTNLEVIRRFEDKINMTLPEEYIAFLLKYNGGCFVEDSFPLADKSISQLNESIGNISWFYGFYESEYYNIEVGCRRMQDRVPKEFIPIGESAGGNRICLCLEQGVDYGKVYYWDHEEEADYDEAPTYDNLYLIANSFTDFINSLFEYKLPDN